jgi:peptidoglycan/xylan/chitin deacetylase (PgdA/CDA1 family)
MIGLAADVAILTFHGVGTTPREVDADERSTWLARDAFESALDLVAKRADVEITFDDGNASDLEIALPALLARGRTAAFFVPAGLIGHVGYLDARGLRSLAAAGMVVGTHGMRHRPWTGMPATAVEEELFEARDRLEQILGREVDQAACPFGAYDRRTLGLLRDAGYVRVYTSDRGRAGRNDWLRARNTVHEEGLAEVRRIVDDRPGVFPALARAAKLAAKRWR